MKQESHGYSLMEVMVIVIMILAIARLAVPALFNSVEKARAAEALTNLAALREGMESYRYQNGSYTTVLTNLDVSVPTSPYFSTPVLSTASTYVSIQRSTGLYTLLISTAGVITCTGNAAQCRKLGY